MPAKTISVRPRQSAEAKILQLAAELDKSPGQFVADAAEAIVAMVEARTPTIPKLVAVARALRQAGITFTTPGQPFDGDVRVLRVSEDEPASEFESQSTASGDGQRSPRTKARRAARATSKSDGQ